jgi:Icc-related predicted phosphoesterase
MRWPCTDPKNCKRKNDLAVKLISDVHGAFQDLPSQVGSEDMLLVLGDILDLVDWADLSGILPEVLGREVFLEKLRTAFSSGPEATMALRDELLSPDGKYFQELFERSAAQYREFGRVLREIGCRAYIIYGNSDIPELLAGGLETVEKAEIVEGTVQIGEEVFGFVSGAIYSPFHMPAEMDEEAYGARLRRLAPLDVLCTHIPPRLQAATFDVVAGRPVEGSSRLLQYIEEKKPAYNYHGHVHQPGQRELLIGRTRVINVGYYRGNGHVQVHGDENGV